MPFVVVEALASRIPDARLASFEGGHLFMMQDFMMQDREGLPAMIAFLEQAGRPG